MEQKVDRASIYTRRSLVNDVWHSQVVDKMAEAFKIVTATYIDCQVSCLIKLETNFDHLTAKSSPEL